MVPATRPADIVWRAVWMGYAVAVAGTIALGGGLFVVEPNVWRVALTGLASLLVAGFTAGWNARTAEPLNGALIAAIYLLTVMAALFGGEILGVLPDPLPGLPRGDSTFFFVWPLGQIATATVGSAVGGWLASATGRKQR
ncbi:MAG: hypothetical protein HY660_13155 [Armatimonadetes bacterium]|nr:hypothetical protein [Armatimonadota bacterium]